MAFKVIDRLFVVVYVGDPSGAEWSAYLSALHRHGIERTSHLVFTDGGGPNAAQRRYLEKVLAGRQVPVAVVSGNVTVRAVVTVLSWFNRRTRAFPRTDAGLRDALAYLEVPASRTELIASERDKLRDSLSTVA
jgi:hypothetical protein